ncbi:hypothetical protein TraAM80_04860 [Trypanosoma rangeli]|uniref:Uncharacterized protein n=1 Tax=Trypanosoma rangeli TaxID=5698 RepID=A0A422NGS6_TRYRA|nr:uncharacterized protein TraAM80_04860 [Trypanosoma rangeli]RNF04664.1 hypothetical protein TraAM80_04860 [Trypanosoma rangeli]|eukprot:RNF04664.1 hypothetical protein TraAM80_04860 [Trypanosoma rangeli]
MTDVDAVEVDEVRRVLLSLGYHNPSADDIALTLQQVREARCSEAEHQYQQQRQRQRQQSSSSVQRNKRFRPSSASPPHAANDVTMAPYENELMEVESDEGSSQQTSTSQKQWPGLSSHSVRGGRTTPMNSTGTGRHPGHGRVAATWANREHCYPLSCPSGGSVVVEGRTQSMRRDRHNMRRVDPNQSFPVGGNKPLSAKESIMIPRGVSTIGGIRGGGLHPLASAYLTPQARLGRHMGRYEKELRALYLNKYGGEELSEPWGEHLDDEEDEHCEEDYTEFGSHEEGGRNLAMCYEGRPQHPLSTPEMPLRPSRVLLSQRRANTIYSFTGDIRYKYRGGLGAPLCAVLGPDGSTLRHRSDPVRRGQQMREMWEKDKFLTQQGRKEDRWRVRQSMLAWEPL